MGKDGQWIYQKFDHNQYGGRHGSYGKSGYTRSAPSWSCHCGAKGNWGSRVRRYACQAHWKESAAEAGTVASAGKGSKPKEQVGQWLQGVPKFIRERMGKVAEDKRTEEEDEDCEDEAPLVGDVQMHCMDADEEGGSMSVPEVESQLELAKIEHLTNACSNNPKVAG